MAIEVRYNNDTCSIYLEPTARLFTHRDLVRVNIYTHPGELSFLVDRGIHLDDQKVEEMVYQAIYNVVNENGDNGNDGDWEAPAEWEHEATTFMAVWKEVKTGIDLLWNAPNAEVMIEMP